MVEKGIRGRVCNTIHRHAKANNKKYTKGFDKNKESSYLKYSDVNNLHDWGMSQKAPVTNFEWVEDTSQFNEGFINSYNEEIDEGYFREDDVQYPEKLHELHNDLLFLPERMKLKKVEKLVTNLHDKTEYVVHIRNLNQALNHGLILKNVHRVLSLIKYMNMNTKLRKKQKIILRKTFSS